MPKPETDGVVKPPPRDKWREGKHDLHIFMSDAEFIRLKALAERDHRKLGQQISYLLEVAINATEGRHARNNRE